MNELKPCPFCGCEMEIKKGKYLNGDKYIEPYGWHDDECPLSMVLWPMEGRWTEKALVLSWNRREDYDY